MRILSPSRRKKDCFDFNRNQNCAPPLVAGGGDMTRSDWTERSASVSANGGKKGLAFIHRIPSLSSHTLSGILKN